MLESLLPTISIYMCRIRAITINSELLISLWRAWRFFFPFPTISDFLPPSKVTSKFSLLQLELQYMDMTPPLAATSLQTLYDTIVSLSRTIIRYCIRAFFGGLETALT